MDPAPLACGVGVEVDGLAVAAGDNADGRALRRLVERHGLVVVRDQHPDPDEQLRWTAALGRVQRCPTHPTARRHPGVAALSNTPSQGFIDVGGFWHADGIFLQTPSRFSVVAVKAVPASGARTHVVDTAALHASLPARLQARLARCWVRYRDVVVHPLVITTAEGDPGVYASPALAAGILHDGSSPAALLGEVEARMEEQGGRSTVTLHAGDLLVWDNFRIAHRAGADLGDGLRLLHRTTTEVVGPEPHHAGQRPHHHGPGWTDTGRVAGATSRRKPARRPAAPGRPG